MALLPSDPQAQKKLVIGVVLPLLLVGAYWYFYHGKKADEITRLESRLEQLEAKNAQAQARARQGGPELEKKLALYEEHISQLEKLVPRKEEVPELLHELNMRARETGVELARLRPNEESPTGYYTLNTYDVVVLGSYHEIGSYLTAIGSLPRIVTPYDLQVQVYRGAGESDKIQLQADFRIKTYVLPSDGEEVYDAAN